MPPVVTISLLFALLLFFLLLVVCNIKIVSQANAYVVERLGA